MPATTTFATLLKELAEELDLGLVIDDAVSALTTITETTTGTSELRGPFSGLQIPVGSPVSVITAGTVGEDSYVSNWVPSTGVLTLSPAISTGATGFIIWKPKVKHAKNIEKAVSRAHQKCRRWMKVPLTYVPDGDMLASTIADYWTASAGTATYQSLGVPEMGGRVIQISHSSTATLTSNTIPARTGEQWYFETAIRATTDGDTAAFVIRDVLAGADITPSYSEGDGSTTSRAFQTQRGTFTVPGTDDTDGRIAFRLDVSGSGTMTAQMAPIVAFPVNARRFPLQQRVLSFEERVGNFHYSLTGHGLEDRSFSNPITVGGRTHSYTHDGDHYLVDFNFSPCEPVYYDELIYGGALTAMTDTTTFAAEYVKRRARAEIYDWLMRSEMGSSRLDNGQPAPSEFRALRNAAVKEAKWSNQEPELMNIVGRR